MTPRAIARKISVLLRKQGLRVHAWEDAGAWRIDIEYPNNEWKKVYSYRDGKMRRERDVYKLAEVFIDVEGNAYVTELRGQAEFARELRKLLGGG